MKIIKTGKRYTTVVFDKTVYGSYGTELYVAGLEYLIPNRDVQKYL